MLNASIVNVLCTQLPSSHEIHTRTSFQLHVSQGKHIHSCNATCIWIVYTVLNATGNAPIVYMPWLPVRHGVGPLAHHSEPASPWPHPVAYDGFPPPVPAPPSDQHTPGLTHPVDTAGWPASLGETKNKKKINGIIRIISFPLYSVCTWIVRGRKKKGA